MKLLCSLILIIAVQGCVTFKRCADKFGTPDTVYVHHRDSFAYPVEVVSPGDSLEGFINCDSLVAALEVSESERLRLSLTPTYAEASAGKARGYKFKVNLKPDTIRDTVEIVREIKVPCPDAVVLDPDRAPRWHEKLWKKFQLFSAYLVLAGIALMALLKAFKRL